MAGELRIRMTVTPETAADAGKGFELRARFTAPSSRILTNTTKIASGTGISQMTSGEDIPNTSVITIETASSDPEALVLMREELQIEASVGLVVETKERGTIDLGTIEGGPAVGMPVGIIRDLLEPAAIISPNFTIDEVFAWIGSDGVADTTFKVIDLGPGVERELAIVSI